MPKNLHRILAGGAVVQTLLLHFLAFPHRAGTPLSIPIMQWPPPWVHRPHLHTGSGCFLWSRWQPGGYDRVQCLSRGSFILRHLAQRMHCGCCRNQCTEFCLRISFLFLFFFLPQVSRDQVKVLSSKGRDWFRHSTRKVLYPYLLFKFPWCMYLMTIRLTHC